MKINDKGLSLIKNFEGCVLKVYPDPATGGRPYSAGVGHAGKDVQSMKIGDPITQAQADTWLKSDISGTEAAVCGFFTGVPLTSNQFSALVCFAFNVGGWRSSTLFKLVKARQGGEAADEFPKWNKAAGKVLEGLTRRREAERALFLKADDLVDGLSK